jgi:hypothetical protein
MSAYTSVKDPAFARTLAQWLSAEPELLVMLRYPNAGGNRDYELHSSSESILARLADVPAQTSVIAFRKSQLRLRGVVTPNFIDPWRSSIADGVEFLLVETTLTNYGRMSWYRNASGTRHSELREELEASLGRPVMLGEYPPWLEDGPDVISGYVPDRNGTIAPGAY